MPLYSGPEGTTTCPDHWVKDFCQCQKESLKAYRKTPRGRAAEKARRKRKTERPNVLTQAVDNAMKEVEELRRLEQQDREAQLFALKDL